eukprot:scaffold4102_cov174-Ochromonas_danica.AAC.15
MEISDDSYSVVVNYIILKISKRREETRSFGDVFGRPRVCEATDRELAVPVPVSVQTGRVHGRAQQATEQLEGEITPQ